VLVLPCDSTFEAFATSSRPVGKVFLPYSFTTCLCEFYLLRVLANDGVVCTVLAAFLGKLPVADGRSPSGYVKGHFPLGRSEHSPSKPLL